MLALTQVEEWHHCSFLVLWWIASEYLSDELLILSSKLEWLAGLIDSDGIVDLDNIIIYNILFTDR